MSKHTRASCNHLTHQYASFHGCTLAEVWVILGCCAVIGLLIDAVLSMYTAKYLNGYFGAFLLTFLINVPITYFLAMPQIAKALGRHRKGRPAGYLTLKMSQLKNRYLGFGILYTTRNGIWTTRRHIK